MTDQDLVLIIGNLQGTMNSVKERVDSIDSKVDTLPCTKHANEITDLETWKKMCVNNDRTMRTEKIKGTISLRNAIIGIVCTGIISAALALITNGFVR